MLSVVTAIKSVNIILIIVVKNCKVSGISPYLLANKLGRIFMDMNLLGQRQKTLSFIEQLVACISCPHPFFLPPTHISQGDAEAQWMLYCSEFVSKVRTPKMQTSKYLFKSGCSRICPTFARLGDIIFINLVRKQIYICTSGKRYLSLKIVGYTNIHGDKI